MNLPIEFVERMKNRLQEGYSEFEYSLKEDAVISLRLNSNKLVSELSFEVGPSIPWCSEGRYLPSRPIFTLDPLYHAGAYYVQEASSMAIDYVIRQHLDLESQPLKILDLCAAPGGKSTLLANLGKEHLLVSNEVIRSRYKILQENLERWGSVNKIITNHDVEDFDAFEGYFDLVLVDAPCSGEGLFRKDSRACSEWSTSNITLCADRQKRILRSAQKLVKSGGSLIYCTCTFNEKENIENIVWLKNSFNLKSKSIHFEEGWSIEEIKSDNCFGYQFFPHRIKGEGFFISCFEQIKDNKNLPAQSGFKRLKSSNSSFQLLPNKLNELISSKIELNNNVLFTDKLGHISAIDRLWWDDVLRFTQYLQRIKPGVSVGEQKGKDLVPDHGLAMAIGIEDKFPRIEVDRKTALQFLKKEPISHNSQLNGWHKVTYKKLPLGWIKVLPNRVNNYLPKYLRIRMDIPKD